MIVMWGNTATADWLLSESLTVLPSIGFVCGQLRRRRSSDWCAGVRWWLGAMYEQAEGARRGGSGSGCQAEQCGRAAATPAWSYLRYCRSEVNRGFLYRVRGTGGSGAEEEVRVAWGGMDHIPYCAALSVRLPGVEECRAGSKRGAGAHAQACGELDGVNMWNRK